MKVEMDKQIGTSQQGFILVWSLLLLVVVTLLGAAGISTSIFEDQMAANEALHKQAFYLAEGGTETTLALLTENMTCLTGFENLSTKDGKDNVTATGNISMSPGSKNFWQNTYSGEIPMASDTNRDFYYPHTSDGDAPHTNGRISGYEIQLAGEPQIQADGYNTPGTNFKLGRFSEYDIKSEHKGPRRSRSAIHIKFRLSNDFQPWMERVCVY